MARPIKVAVIGTGLAGLTTAYFLSTKRRNEQFDVHLFEKTATLGMDSSSITLPIPELGTEWRIDVPMRSFQGGYYPKLIALYKQLGVSFRKSNFSYSFSMLSPPTNSHRQRITTAMIYNGSSGLSGVSMPSTMAVSDKYPFPIRVALKAWSLAMFAFIVAQLLVCYVRLLFLSIPFLRSPRLKTMSFKDWAVETIPQGTIASCIMLDLAWRDFTQFVLLPLFSAVCTASLLDVAEHPIEELLDYIWLTLGTHHYVITNGVRDVVSKLVWDISSRNIHLSSPITAVEVDAEDVNLVSVHCRTPNGNKIYSGFRHIVFATEAPRAIPLLSSYLSSIPSDLTLRRDFVEKQIECLQKFSYTSTIVINHTDETLLPDTTKDRRDLNLIYLDPLHSHTVPKSSSPDKESLAARKVPSTYTMATHILPRPKGFPSHLPAVFQTTNPIIEPKEGRILSVARLERAVMTLKSKQALKDLHIEHSKGWWRDSGKLGRLQGTPVEEKAAPGIWICGSFAYPGIPLLEGCVVSAKTVTEQGIMAHEIATRTRFV